MRHVWTKMERDGKAVLLYMTIVNMVLFLYGGVKRKS